MSQTSQTNPPIENPWLANRGTSTKVSRQKNEVLVSKHSSLATKSKASFKKQLGRAEDALACEADDAVVEISLDEVMTVDPAKQKPKANGKGKAKFEKSVVDPAFRNSDDEGDDVEERDQGAKAFEQRDLVALAFAGDNVVEVNNGQVSLLHLSCSSAWCNVGIYCAKAARNGG